MSTKKIESLLIPTATFGWLLLRTTSDVRAVTVTSPSATAVTMDLQEGFWSSFADYARAVGRGAVRGAVAGAVGAAVIGPPTCLVAGFVGGVSGGAAGAAPFVYDSLVGKGLLMTYPDDVLDAT